MLRPRSYGWGVCFAVLGLAFFLVASATIDHVGQRSFLTSLGFIGAVVAASAAAGLWTGLLATALVLGALDFLYYEPFYSFRIADTNNQLRLAAFAVLGLTISLLGEGLQIARKRVRDRQRRLEEEIERRELADRRKDEFLAMLAHELRNPLAPIRYALEMVRSRQPLDPEVEQAREMIERQVCQMTHLVDDLLDVGRISHGTLRLRKERTELEPALRIAVEATRPHMDASQHELTVSIPQERIFLEADPTRLAQIVANLLDNSAKYTDRGGRISLSAARQEDNVVIAVRDNGIGIAPDMLPQVFDMFAQADHSIERTRGGLGIGLTLVRRLVELHGGQIEASSAGPGRGSEFIVRLPCLPASDVPEPDITPAATEPTLQRSRILIVDDNRDAAQSLAALIRLQGADVRTAHDGLAALDVAAEFRPEVIFLDIGLPQLNGYDVCRRMREHPWGKEATIVAITGWGQEEDRAKSKAAGFDHHAVKPVEYATLLKLLASPVAT